jgi:TfuA protein
MQAIPRKDLLMASSGSLAVFCGPSLPPEDRISVKGICYLPPAARGDIERAAARFDNLLLIDGVFHHDLAPSPAECYRAAQRIRCFGAASLGALRAAECRLYGFMPLGIIARWYIREVIDGDDEVAVAVDPRTQSALSVSSVNVRYVARLAVRRGIIARSEADRLVAQSREVFYADRTWEDVLTLAPAKARAALGALAERRGDLKRLDGRFALRSVLRTLYRREHVYA